MANNSAKPQGEQRSPRRTHEQKDVSLKGLLVILVLLAVSALVLQAGLWWWLQRMNKSSPTPTEAKRGYWAAHPRPEAQRTFPKLQLSPRRDLQAYLGHQDKLLNSYGWINHTAGVVRIPIERAMERIAQNGLPQWGRTNGAQTGPSPYELQRQRALEAGTNINEVKP